MLSSKQLIRIKISRGLALWAMGGFVYATLHIAKDHPSRLIALQVVLLPLSLIAGWIGYLGASSRFTNPPVVNFARAACGFLAAIFLAQLALAYALTSHFAAAGGMRQITNGPSPIMEVVGTSMVAYVLAGLIRSVGSRDRYRAWYSHSRLVRRVRDRAPGLAPPWE
jgi:hypothetical protein